MEEEVNQKVVSLTVRTGKLTASILARAMRDFLDGQKVKPHKYAKQVIQEYKEKAAELNKNHVQSKHHDRHRH